MKRFSVAAYEEGGYEAGPASGVTAEAEAVLLAAMKKMPQRE
ncbi:hypothetical protein [Parapedobacter defluvii]|nr:hypothetical protein [Parapedobacter defluvii]